jgi:hypothetical protein
MRKVRNQNVKPAMLGRWESFRIRRVALVSYLVGSKDEPPVAQTQRYALAMFCSDECVRAWYPVKKDVLLDCKLMTLEEVSAIKDASTDKTKEILEPLWHNGKIKSLTPGMHPELVRKWKRTVWPFVRSHTPKPAPTGQ